jgi:hypothetical protein
MRRFVRFRRIIQFPLGVIRWIRGIQIRDHFRMTLFRAPLHSAKGQSLLFFDPTNRRQRSRSFRKSFRTRLGRPAGRIGSSSRQNRFSQLGVITINRQTADSIAAATFGTATSRSTTPRPSVRPKSRYCNEKDIF